MRHTITVLGLGYIGLPTALLLAAGGNRVYGYDINTSRVKNLQDGTLPFEEHGLKELFSGARRKKTFTAVNRVLSTPVYIIAVPTPHKGYHADLQFVRAACKQILPFVTDKTLIIVESTIGPTDSVKKLYPYFTKHGRHPLFAYCPERAIPGKTIHEMRHNVRVIGGYTPQAAKMAQSLYRSFVKNDIQLTDVTTAEACKVMENTYRDVNIALANEFGKAAAAAGFNVWKAIQLANLHPRVHIHQPGPGVGGHCIAIDPWYMAGLTRDMRMIKTARKINDGMPAYVYKELDHILKVKKISAPRIGILGYAYKKNVSDWRETPAGPLSNYLKKRFSVMIHDPYVRIPAVSSNLDEILGKVSVVILVTDHDIYKTIDFRRYKNIRVVYDTRNCLTKDQFAGTNAQYHLLGSPYTIV